jgi:hypothetical protein
MDTPMTQLPRCIDALFQRDFAPLPLDSIVCVAADLVHGPTSFTV